MIKTCYQGKYQHKYKGIYHFIHIKSTMPKMLLIHGTGSGAVAWADCFPILSAEFDIYVLDIPENTQLTVKALHKLIDFEDKVVLVGHSFGAYVAAQYALQFYEQVTHLGLVSPAGLLPTLGCYGYYWAWFFRNQWVIRILYMLYGVWDTRYKYWAAHVNNNVANYITLTWSSAYWNAPLFNLLGYLRCNVRTFYGTHDSIVPLHQGKFIERTIGIPCIEIKDTGHCIHGQAATTLCNEIVYWYQSRTPTLKKAKLNPKTWASTWSPQYTQAMIDQLYLSIP